MLAYVLVFPICIYLISAGEALDVVVERSALTNLSLLNDQLRNDSCPIAALSAFAESDR